MLALNKTPDESDYEISEISSNSKKDEDKPIKNCGDVSKAKSESFQSLINSSHSGYFSYEEDSQIGNEILYNLFFYRKNERFKI